jgi:hypothetical protein
VRYKFPGATILAPYLIKPAKKEQVDKGDERYFIEAAKRKLKKYYRGNPLWLPICLQSFMPGQTQWTACTR